ncbi:CGNR zinc finger domain-containing protein [Streptomyces sp. NPDC091377]|uniref:CGNR zinc finger domain-containing protein n=1 Tax=unclassified Streptomyces TaxID=2593676 RepID=UPI00382870D0
MALRTATETTTARPPSQSPAALSTPTGPLAPRFDVGRPCLGLLATTHPAERLGSLPELGDWIARSRLVPPGTVLAHADPTWPAAFRELRFHLDRLVRAALAPGTVPADRAAASLAHVNVLARAAAPPAPRAVRAADGTLVRELAGPPECAALLAALARDAVELLTDPAARAGLRQCEGDNCPVVYLDTSRGRRRRWCSSEVCGNRERVARHRRRAAATPR